MLAPVERDSRLFFATTVGACLLLLTNALWARDDVVDSPLYERTLAVALQYLREPPLEPNAPGRDLTRETSGSATKYGGGGKVSQSARKFFPTMDIGCQPTVYPTMCNVVTQCPTGPTYCPLSTTKCPQGLPECPPVVGFVSSAHTFWETSGTVHVSVGVSRPTPWEIRVSFNIIKPYEPSATRGSDYLLTTGTLILRPNAVSTSFPLTLIDDRLYEGGEWIILELANPSTGALSVAHPTCSVTIVDDDPLPVIGFSQRTGRVSELVGVAQIPVRLSAVSGAWAAVDFGTEDTSPSWGTARPGEDYLPSHGYLSLEAGQTVGYIPIQILRDRQAERDETINVRLHGAHESVLGISTHTLTIANETATPHWPLYR